MNKKILNPQIIRPYSDYFRDFSLKKTPSIKNGGQAAFPCKSLNQLKNHQFVPFISLFTPPDGRLEVIVIFLARMKLIKELLVDIVQSELFGPIHIKAKVNE